jgi:hypothetical protein
MWLVIFIGIPVVGAVIGGTSVGAISSFVPSGSQQLVPSDGTSFSGPVTCTTTARSDPKPALASAVRIAYSDDGEIFNVRPGGEVTVRYIYGGSGHFARHAALPGPGEEHPRTRRLHGRFLGGGSVYVPQPNGAQVAKLEVVSLNVAVDFLLAAVALVAIFVAIVLTRRLRRAVIKPRM